MGWLDGYKDQIIIPEGREGYSVTGEVYQMGKNEAKLKEIREYLSTNDISEMCFNANVVATEFTTLGTWPVKTSQENSAMYQMKKQLRMHPLRGIGLSIGKKMDYSGGKSTRLVCFYPVIWDYEDIVNDRWDPVAGDYIRCPGESARIESKNGWSLIGRYKMLIDTKGKKAMPKDAEVSAAHVDAQIKLRKKAYKYAGREEPPLGR